MDFPLLLRNTLVIAGLGTIGAVGSSILVAYGLARFHVPFGRSIMVVLIATIILPRYATLVPTYTIFLRIGWVGTWLPLIVPHFFANAFNVFLLRRYLPHHPQGARRSSHHRWRRPVPHDVVGPPPPDESPDRGCIPFSFLLRLE